MAPIHLQSALLASAQVEAVRQFTTPAEDFEHLTEETHRSFLPEATHDYIDSADEQSPNDLETIVQALV